jgi:hypothetical protein
MRKSPNGTPRRAALTLAALLFAGGTSQPAAAQQRVAAGPKVIAAGSGDPVAPSYRATSTRETVAVTIDHAKVIR